jgi:putative tricarboxylic transport membrane protein
MTAAIAWFVFGAITAGLSVQYPIGSLWAPGSGLYPLVLGLMLMGLAAAHAVRLHLEQPKPAVAPGAAPRRLGDATRRVLLFIGVAALATALLQPIGYVASGFLLMLGLLRVFGVRWGVAALIAVLAAVASHFLFVQVLGIPMPAGPFGF